MYLAKTDEPLVNYAEPDVLLVVPTTTFIKQDGRVTLVDEDAKILEEKFPDMSLYFGYMMSSDIPYPVYRHSDANMIGIPDRVHYRSPVNPELVAEGLVTIYTIAEEYRDMMVYLFPFGGDAEANKEMFDSIPNIVLLIKEEAGGEEEE